MMIKNIARTGEPNGSDSRKLEFLPGIRERIKEGVEARQKQAVLHIESAIKSEPENLRIGFRKRENSERKWQSVEEPHFKIELFQVSPKGHLSDAHPVGGRAEAFCKQLERLLAPWGCEVLAMRAKLAPEKYYAIIPIEKLAAELSVGLMGAEVARAWMAEREAVELSKVSGAKSDLTSKGIRL